MTPTSIHCSQYTHRLSSLLTMSLVCILTVVTAAAQMVKFSSPDNDAAKAFRAVHVLELPKVLPDEEGSISFRVSPQGWQQGEGKWHFFFELGNPKDENHRRLMLYKFPDDQLRLLWQENKEKFISLQAPVIFKQQQWHHIAFTWQQKNFSCQTALYFDGTLLKKQNQQGFFDPKLLGTQLRVGETHDWNPVSSKGSAIKDFQVLTNCLTAEEIALIAAPKQTLFQSYEAIPEVENQFSALVLGASNYRWLVQYLDEQGRQLHQEAFDFHFNTNGSKANACKFGFTPPPMALQCVFQLQNTDNPSGDITFSNPQLQPGMLLRKVPEPYWKGCWIWDSQNFEAGAYRYLRYSFQLNNPEQIRSAFAQWLTDESAELFLNGHYIGKVTSWARPKYSENLAKLLKGGENVLAAKAFNLSGAAAFLAELTLNYPDRFETIASTPDWKISSREETGWEKNGFDDSAWDHAICRVKIPRNPYGLVPYSFFGNRQNVRIAGHNAPAQVTGSSEQRIEVEILCEEAELTAKEAELGFYKNDRPVSIRQVPLVKIAPKRWRLADSWRFPLDAEKGIYEIRMNHPTWSFPEGNIAGSFHYQPAPKAPAITSRIARTQGVPRLLINEKPTPFVTYKVGIGGRQDQLSYLDDFYEAGVKIFEISLSLGNLWTAQDTLDFQLVDAAINQYLFAAPEGNLLINLSIYAPNWWLAAHPEETTRFEQDSIPQYAFSSEIFREESTFMLQKLLEYLESKTCSNRIIGYFLVGGEDGQWMLWVKGGSGAMSSVANKRLSDYSDPMKKYFHNWLKKKYRTVGKLNRAWSQNHNSFTEITLPSEIERKAVPGGFLYDPAKYQPVIDFQQALSDSVTDLLLSYSTTIKKVTKNRKTVGLYYGKLFTIGGHNEWAEFGLQQLLKAPSIDYFSGPSYFQRQPGRPHSVSAPLATIALHGKMFIDEADLRTYAGGAQSWAYTGNPWDTVHTMRKIMALNLVENQGVRWFDIHPGEFATPAIMNAIKQLSQTAEATLQAPTRKAEIAVITSEKSLTGTSMEVIDYMRRVARNQWEGLFYRIGAPVDFHLLEDLQDKKFPKYKLYVFLNAWHLDKDQRRAIKKLQQSNAVILWFHAPGILSENGLSIQQTEEITGFKLQQLQQLPKTMEISATEEVPFLQSLEPLQTGLGNINPLFAPVSSTETTLFGRMGSQAAGACKNIERGKSIYLAAPLMSPELLRNIARFADCHLYCDDPDAMLYVGNNLFALHCGKAGTRTITFPEPVQLQEQNCDVMLNDSPSSKIHLPMQAGETKLFRILR